MHAIDSILEVFCFVCFFLLRKKKIRRKLIKSGRKVISKLVLGEGSFKRQLQASTGYWGLVYGNAGNL